MDALPALSWFMLGVATAFLLSALNAFVFGGIYGFVYLTAGGFSAFASFVVAMWSQRSRRANAVQA